VDQQAPKKLDLKKEFKHLYLPTAREVTVVDVPEMKFIVLDGRIEPNETPGTSPGFAEAIGALYGLAYTLKFMSKLRPVDPIDYTVMALEGLWAASEGGADFATFSDWPWTLMIMQPAHINQEMFAQALMELKNKRAKAERRGAGATEADASAEAHASTEAHASAGAKATGAGLATGAADDRSGSGAFDRVRLESFREGLCLQIMHVGPYADEVRTLEKMAAFAASRGYVFHGRHHEIYLGDPRTAKPENLRTVLRRPVLITE
jgi:hypothetical protein